MGFYDRDYYRDAPYAGAAGRSPVGSVRMWSVTTWLIVLNVAVFVIDQFLAGSGVRYVLDVVEGGRPRRLMFPPLEGWGHFSAGTALLKFQVWRFVSFQFLHANLLHLLFNMIALYFFGPLIEMYLGSRTRYLAFYLLCGVGGAVAYLALWGFGVLGGGPWVPLVGASAGIFGILIAAAQVAPHATVLIYGILPMRLRTMAWFLLAMSVYVIFTNGRNAGGEAAHFGGAAVGFLLLRYPRALDVLVPERRRLR
jgi:membrane associated rhomboid family serine protease